MSGIEATQLSAFDLFRGLADVELGEIASACREKRFRTATTLVSVEQPGEVVYLIISGTVKVFVEQPDGSDVIIAILGPGDCLGEMSLFRSPNRSASAIAIEDVMTVWIDRRVLGDLLLRIPKLTFNFACVLADRLRLADAQIQALASLEVECRVARQLLGFADHYGQQSATGETLIPIRLTQGDLAAMVGASRERINRVIVSYKERNYISVDQNHHITIRNRQALARRVS